MDATFGIEGYGHQGRIVLCLDKAPHQLTVLSHVRAVVELCMTSISCDPLEAGSVRALKDFDGQLQQIQKKALQARKARVKMQVLPSILSPGAQANDIDDSDPESDVGSINLLPTLGGAPQRDSEFPRAPSTDLIDGKGGGLDLHERDSHEKPAEANSEYEEQAPKPRTPTAGVGDRVPHASASADGFKQAGPDPHKRDLHEKSVEANPEPEELAPMPRTPIASVGNPHASASGACRSPQPDDLPIMGDQKALFPAPTPPCSSRVAGRPLYARMKFYKR